VAPTTLVEYRSRGARVIIGPEAQAVTIAERLQPALRCTVVAAPGGAAPATPGKHPFPVVHEKVVQVSGHLGLFSVIVSAPPPLGGINLIQKLGGVGDQAHYDLVLDLSQPPLLDYDVAPLGYYAPGESAEALERALKELPEMTGEFEKPRFFHYNPDICAHGANGVTACTRCLDTCPTGAIHALGDEVAVDPYLCQGAGICASVCPTGAMGYRYPSLSGQLARVAMLLKTYRQAGGEPPLLLLHDAEGGRERVATLAAQLPEWVVPYEIAEIGSLGMDAWFAALAHGARAVALLPARATPPRVLDALNEQLRYGGALLAAMGYAPDQARLLGGDDAAVLAALGAVPIGAAIPAATFGGVDEKRTMLRLAIEHLHQHAPRPQEVAALPAGAPFGEITVNGETCTLCMACVGACPVGALADGNELPQLNFVEANCVQCGLCAATCPEDAIALSARYLFDPLVRRTPRVLHEETPFCCISCGKPFATRKMMASMTEKLRGHWMFQGDEALRRVQMCADCRVRDLYRGSAKRPETI
jgi:ferredoxin